MAQVLKEEVKERIMSTAVLEFFDKGFDNSSLRKIALGAGITPGNLYHYFDNKEALYEEIVGSAYRKLNKIFAEVTNNQLDMDQEFTIENYDRLRREHSGKIAERVISEILEFFSSDYLAVLILLKDDRAEFVLNSRFRMIDWIASQFKYIYGDEKLAKDLAYSFTEGIIHICTTSEDDMSDRIVQFVGFYFMKGLD
ncbi:TetR/AcrR family transcriptional regulator [Acidaminobacter sp. JC074]|uniref:TetR/AcrR family transcriptional regulator n=1 Tax=Acidaminobacter sp. JC074 TaxID=2530199 RepID=UPI001F10941B|nr:TetR/AcrR family transcriptional regulator [Acidaminobacter sp. JC074]